MKQAIATRIGTNDLDIYNEVVTQDCYGVAELEKRLAKDRATIHVIDIGAHIGTFLYALSQKLRNVRNVYYYGFEPYIPNFKLLKVNADFVASCCPWFNIHPFVENKAVVGPKETARLCSVDGFNTGMVKYTRTEVNDIGDSVVPSVDINHVSLYHIDILKIDCEGAEEWFFEYIPFTNIDNIVGEYHSFGMIERIRELFGHNKGKYDLIVDECPTNKHQGVFKLLSHI